MKRAVSKPSAEQKVEVVDETSSRPTEEEEPQEAPEAQEEDNDAEKAAEEEEAEEEVVEVGSRTRKRKRPVVQDDEEEEEPEQEEEEVVQPPEKKKKTDLAAAQAASYGPYPGGLKTYAELGIEAAMEKATSELKTTAAAADYEKNNKLQSGVAATKIGSESMRRLPPPLSARDFQREVDRLRLSNKGDEQSLTALNAMMKAYQSFIDYNLEQLKGAVLGSYFNEELQSRGGEPGSSEKDIVHIAMQMAHMARNGADVEEIAAVSEPLGPVFSSLDE